MSAAGHNHEDIRLLKEARAGASDAFACFYRRHSELVLAFAARRTRDPEAAADVLGETFAAALTAVLSRRGRLPEQPVAWLLTIARNKIADSYRRGAVQQAARRRMRLERLEPDEEDIRRIEALIDEPDLDRRLKESLPPEQCAALKARVFDELEYPEIASTLRCSEALARQRVSRALKALRNAMEAPR